MRVEDPTGSNLFGYFTGNSNGVRVEAFGLSRSVVLNGATVEIQTSALNEIAFFGAAGAAQAGNYSVSNVSTDRAYDADSVTIGELADVLGTLIDDLQSYGLIG